MTRFQVGDVVETLGVAWRRGPRRGVVVHEGRRLGDFLAEQAARFGTPPIQVRHPEVAAALDEVWPVVRMDPFHECPCGMQFCVPPSQLQRIPPAPADRN
jgi:hypothetical protein